MAEPIDRLDPSERLQTVLDAMRRRAGNPWERMPPVPPKEEWSKKLKSARAVLNDQKATDAARTAAFGDVLEKLLPYSPIETHEALLVALLEFVEVKRSCMHTELSRVL